MSSDTKQTIQQLVEEHVQKHGQLIEGHQQVAISASQKLHWANEAGIGIDQVEAHLQSVCEPVETDNEYQSVPSYRLK